MSQFIAELTAPDPHKRFRELVLITPDGLMDESERAILSDVTPASHKSTPPGGIVFPATWPSMVQLASEVAWHTLPQLRGAMAAELARRGAVTPVENALGLRADAPPPRHYQKVGAGVIAATGGGLVFDDPGCLSGDTELILNRAGRGFRMKIRDVVRKFNGGPERNHRHTWDLSIPTMVQREVDGAMRSGRVVGAWSSGVKTTYTVTTSTGRTIRATDEHPFLTDRGWLRLDELCMGDKVHVRGTQKGDGTPRAKRYYRERAGLYGHPYANKRDHKHSPYRVPVHRLIAEARLNGMEYETFVTWCRNASANNLVFIDPDEFAVHHIDHDPLNNDDINLRVMSHHDHHVLHAMEGKTNQVLFKVAAESITAIEYFGREETFDIAVADDPHNFVANGFVVHNTGKTLTAILGLLACRDRGHLPLAAPIVVVCPNSVIDSWVAAWHTWTTLRAVAWRGNVDRRTRLCGVADVYVVGYATAANDFSADHGTSHSQPLADLRAQAMIIDECHWIKNPDALRSQVIRKAAAAMPVVVGLSGTPITHNSADLWPILYATDSASWPSRERYVRRYLRTVPGDYDETVVGLNPFREPEFRMCLLGRYRSLRKADVLTQLPPKVYSVREIELPSKYRTIYDQMENDMLAHLDEVDPDTGERKTLPAFTVLAQLMRLNQLAAAAADVTTEDTGELDELTGEPKIAVHVTLKDPSWKVDALAEIMEERRDRQSLVFAPSAQLIRLAGRRLEREGYRVGYVIGGQTAAERTEVIDAFQAGKLDVVLLTTGAGGVGITLTAADTVVFIQRPWSYVDASQAEDRAHRIGSEQHERVEIIDIVAKDTVETRIREVLRDKAKSLAELLEDPRIQRDVLGGLK
ncbi:MAG TPA: SNF2-related protein [Pseudonocardiaceae bacterium]